MRLRFRAYQQQSLKEFVAEQPAIGPQANDTGNTVEAITHSIETTAREQEQPVELDINNLAPRKPNWDLKRDLSKKLELLNHQTDIAIAEIIRFSANTGDRLRKDGDIAQIGSMDRGF
jgi:predicted lipoprotein